MMNNLKTKNQNKTSKSVSGGGRGRSSSSDKNNSGTKRSRSPLRRDKDGNSSSGDSSVDVLSVKEANVGASDGFEVQETRKQRRNRMARERRARKLAMSTKSQDQVPMELDRDSKKRALEDSSSGEGEVDVSKPAKPAENSGKKKKVETSTEEPAASSKPEDPAVGEGSDLGDSDPLLKCHEITAGLRHLVHFENNKVTKWMGQRILHQAAKYEVLVQRLLMENARLTGRLEEREKLSRDIELVDRNVNELNENVMRLKTDVGSLPKSAAASIAQSIPTEKRSYAVIVRGAKEELTVAEVKQRLVNEVCPKVNVRVRSMRQAKGGGIVIEAASEKERRLIAERSEFADAGLRVDQPKALDPRVLICDVPQETPDAEMMETLYEQSGCDTIQKCEFQKRARIVRKIPCRGKELCNLVVELPMACREKLLSEGRVYSNWNSFRVRVWERIPRCFVCLGFDHRAAGCPIKERLCWKCSKPGHTAVACNSAEDCGNCRKKKQPSGHSIMSPQCPEYCWRLKMLRSRFSNG